MIHGNFEKLRSKDLFSFVVGNGEVISGWDKRIIGCEVDSIYKIVIPYREAYGESNVYYDIPEKTDIVIKFKIVEIN